MFGGMGSSATPDLSQGGEINGDITITGDLKVEGGGSFTYDEIIEGTLQTQGKLTVTSSSGLDIINTGNNTVFHIPSSSAYTFGTQTNNHMSMWTNNTERMRITNAGKVGINVTAPSTFVEIQDGLTTTGAVLTLSTKETTVVDNDVLGRINFQAPLETGTDAIKVGASIHAEAEDTFSSTINSTGLVFSTHTTDTATERMRITSGGRVDIFCDTSNWPLGIYSYGASA